MGLGLLRADGEKLLRLLAEWAEGPPRLPEKDLPDPEDRDEKEDRELEEWELGDRKEPPEEWERLEWELEL